MAQDKIIQFPGLAGRTNPPAVNPPTDETDTGEAETDSDQDPKAALPMAGPGSKAARGPDGLTEDQRKAVQLVLSGMAFVCIGIKPTDRGADFFTAVDGDPGDLRNALDHLGGVIERAYGRKGLI
ncbi:hypothetical protein LBMAG53_20680 [Planctomycetota bacterium]|nr:hypothetical protein LBMAG53_20680 [Planctomycetota bacterium]